jgi:hypothetical protein
MKYKYVNLFFLPKIKITFANNSHFLGLLKLGY